MTAVTSEAQHHDLVLQLLEAMNLRIDQRVDAVEAALAAASERRTATAEETDRRYQQQYECLRERMDASIGSREAQTAQADRRYEERFASAERAVSVALMQSDKEFRTHLEQVREETKSALAAADKAISKSEVATEKRFEAVNEFRAQLGDQARTFMPRTEAQVLIANLSEKVDLLASRQDATVNHGLGTKDAVGYLFAAAGFASAVVAIAFALTK